MKNINPYLIRRLEENSDYFSKSFSSRYMNWKRQELAGIELGLKAKVMTVSD